MIFANNAVNNLGNAVTNGEDLRYCSHFLAGY
jgi:hypothetical protein